MRIGHRVRRHTAGRLAELSDEDFALFGREPLDLAYEDVKEAVAQFDKIVRLPVIVSTRSQQRVERALPCCEWLHANHISNRLSERAQWFQGAVPVALIAHVADRKDEDLLAVNVGRKEGERWGHSEDPIA